MKQALNDNALGDLDELSLLYALVASCTSATELTTSGWLAHLKSMKIGNTKLFVLVSPVPKIASESK